ncbi:hypothetical protein KZ545_004386, partial [Escherichia coli]|nr:hypothetical protein [Escherichia coli]
MARVIRISASDAKYGGNIYESNINKALQNFNITTFFALSWVPKKVRYFFAPIFYLLNFIKCNFCDADIVIVPLEAISFLSKKKKNIVVVHHIDHSFSSFFSSLNQIFTYFLLVLNKNRINKIVVVSEYWEKYLQGKGFNNIQIIYNDIDISLRDEVKKSIRNFRVEGKTNIYIGNFHKKKGTYDLLSLLKDHYVLHTSGYKGQQIEGLINHSRLSYP